MSDSSKLVEHFFRHEYGRLVAVLTNRLGLHCIDLAEDAAQSALSQAIISWSRNGIPKNPGGWLYRIAIRDAIDTLRRQSVQQRFVEESSPNVLIDTSPDPSESDLLDDQLRLLLACCAPSLAIETSVALALKVMGGFSVAEIAHAFLTSQANIQKRITRAKEKLRQESSLMPHAIGERIQASLMVIYLLFNEGYYSSHNEIMIRRELCDEAKRLARLIVEHPEGARPESFALLALMYFHGARLDTRTDLNGDVLLLDQQDRTRWNWDEIREGMDWMRRSASGDYVSRFHIEASIAWEHCRAQNFQDTDWNTIRNLYQLLLARVCSPAQWINRAIAEFYCSGAEAALALMNSLPSEQQPKNFPIWHTFMGYLHFQRGDHAAANSQWIQALNCTHSRAEQELLRRRIASTLKDH